MSASAQTVLPQATKIDFLQKTIPTLANGLWTRLKYTTFVLKKTWATVWKQIN